MTNSQIEHTRQELYKYLSERRLKESFGLLNQWKDMLQNWDFTRRLEEMESSYQYMIKYMLDGFHDPERTSIYNKLILSAYALTDKMAGALLEKESNSVFFTRKRHYESLRDRSLSSVFEKVDNLISNVSLNKLLNEQEFMSVNGNEIESQFEHEVSELFLRIWTNTDATEEDYQLLKEAFSPMHFPVNLTALLVSALFLNLLQRYDERKFSLLLEVSGNQDHEIAQRAVVAAVLLMYIYRDRIDLSPGLKSQLDALAEDATFCESVRNIYIQLIRTKETEKISRKLTDEILPEMMKISPSLYKKIRQDELMNDLESLDKNPEWQELLDRSGVSDKLKELSDLQMEGADVFMSTFSGLKGFIFFTVLSNWFIPFSMENAALKDVFPKNNAKNKFSEILLQSSFLCNSDKYSFCLSLTQLPPEQREMMFAQFNMEGQEMQNLQKEEELLKKDLGKKEILSNQYIQDLYRFFKLHPRRFEFSDPFSLSLNLSSDANLRKFFSDKQSLRLIAEFYFKKEYYEEALELFNELLADDSLNSELSQKAGYCYQMLGDYRKALDSYKNAELMSPNSFWTVRRIGACYRNLKEPEKALEYYLLAEKLSPDNLSVEMNLGHCCLEQKRYEEALKYYFKVEYMDSRSTKAWRPIAWCSFLTGKKEQAERYYGKIMQDKPLPQDYLNAGHVAFSLGKIRDAIGFYKQSIVADGSDFEKFLRNFRQDIPDLLNAEVAETDIPILLDELMYGVEELKV